MYFVTRQQTRPISSCLLLSRESNSSISLNWSMPSTLGTTDEPRPTEYRPVDDRTQSLTGSLSKLLKPSRSKRKTLALSFIVRCEPVNIYDFLCSPLHFFVLEYETFSPFFSRYWLHSTSNFHHFFLSHFPFPAWL